MPKQVTISDPQVLIDEINRFMATLKKLLLYSVYICIQVAGLAALGLCCKWVVHHLGGYSLATPEQIFNYHPALMILSMIVINGNGILVYRIQRCVGYRQQKWLHFGIQFVATVLALVGAYAVYHFHAVKHIPHLYSLHSWLGLSVLVTMILMSLAGFVTFLWPGLGSSTQRLIIPLHAFYGLFNFLMAAMVVLTGLTEKALFSMTSPGQQYRDSPPAAQLVNLIGIAVVICTALVLGLAINDDLRRRVSGSGDKQTKKH
ncbi:plasma membrane ascorbate-dependent reductase CYBRD1-like [Oppia nitens]|uniref:plasma membrane ascorbate-dependent reductase CYBRD1-like n=1 Tax=Oppia nitens TaxID=1686743 RepID=UPI0023DA0A85|nr:plasma membrane ascorbate-dependent reductase CYBRD1-like [Oppia nitens]